MVEEIKETAFRDFAKTKYDVIGFARFGFLFDVQAELELGIMRTSRGCAVAFAGVAASLYLRPGLSGI